MVRARAVKSAQGLAKIAGVIKTQLAPKRGTLKQGDAAYYQKKARELEQKILRKEEKGRKVPEVGGTCSLDSLR